MNNPAVLTEALRRLITASSLPTGPSLIQVADALQGLQVSQRWQDALLASWAGHYSRFERPLFTELARRGPPRFLSATMLGNIKLQDAPRICRLCGLEVLPPKICWHTECWAAFEPYTTTGWKRICKDVIRRANYKCELCELDIRKKRREAKIYEVDHILPVALGGQNTIDNLQILCRPCHLEKTRADMVLIKESRPINKTTAGKKGPIKRPKSKKTKKTKRKKPKKK